MRLALETGEGLPDSNSYIDGSDVAWHMPGADAERWEALGDEGRAQSLVAASLFIDASFGWKGRRGSAGQAMSWPRSGVFLDGSPVPDDIVPARVRQACVMAVAVILDKGMGAFMHSGEREAKQESEGSLSRGYFDKGDLADGVKSGYRHIDNLLRGLWEEPVSRIGFAGVRRA